jgi:hypothetical protein
VTLGLLFFASPWALAALIVLPALYFILRASPPPPRRTLFPPSRLLEGLATEEQTRERAPLWLLLLRALILMLAIIGFARPSLAPQAAASASGATLIVIDDGWTSAAFWTDVRATALDSIAQAERGGGAISFLLTAPETPARAPEEVFTPAAARAFISRLEPKAWRPDRADAARRLAQTDTHYAHILWIADGLNDAGARAFAETLRGRGPVAARVPLVTAHAIANAETSARGVEIEARRAASAAPETLAIAAETLEGRALGAAEARFAPGDALARTHIALPPEIAARAARVRLTSETSAGATRLLASGAGRPFVGLVDPGGDAQALVSDVFYLDRALSPYAGLERGNVEALIRANVQAILAPDAARLTAADRASLERWVRRGGLLVRFAGPRLANQADELLPVRLRPGARALGGALAWEQAQGIAPFADESPFAGLSPPADVLVRRLVTAEPISLEQASVWASLADGAPIVTAAPRGDGLIVLYHVGAGPGWSDLPLSGLYVDMLRRTLAFAGRTERAETQQGAAAGPYVAERLLDGFGVLAPTGGEAVAVPAERFASARADPDAPPGLYVRGGLSSAINAARGDEQLAGLDLPAGISRARLGQRVERPLAWAFLGAAAVLLALDLLISLYLAGRLPRLPRRASPGVAMLAFAFLFTAPDAHAQQGDPTLVLRLAYVRTGDSNLDATSRAGLEALSQTLRDRTAVEPGPPIAVDLARDDLSALPFLYWPASNTPARLSDAAIENLGHYLSIGGLLLLDTRELGRAAPRGREPAALMLAGLGAPPLEPVTTDHVAARAFYLLRGFPGRIPNARLWAESGAAAASRDGVAALFIGDGDWAAAWSGRADLPGGARQRELSLRFGVNLVMVALTGNYKADQVHVPALLERLGREAR